MMRADLPGTGPAASGVNMRFLVVLTLMLAALLPQKAQAQVVWVQPASMFLMGPSLQESLSNFQLRALSAGANIPVLGKEIVIELTLAPGATPTACPTWFWGGWLSAGVLFPLGKSATDGFFVQPKVTASYFDQRQAGGDCVDPTATTTRWSSVEWGLGADVGFQATLGPFYVSPLIGATVGQCIDCPAQTTVLTPYTPYLGKAGERISRLSFGLNLNLLRVGFVF
ncbi:MAG TPA: hypothetical protein VK447_01005 [Myxococcaceae bacterium]|nr:hypothetical protein [Myxococcaceae bacterium]